MPSPNPTPKRIANRYDVRGELGRGGMGTVYHVVDTRDGRELALKTLRDPANPAFLELFHRERKVLKDLAHPNIVSILEWGDSVDGGVRRPFFVMPLLRGHTLDEVIQTEPGRLTLERCLLIISQVGRGLQAAHEAGVVHRDLKPSNIFLLKDDAVTIIDFGVAHLINLETSEGQKGTYFYMSPEQMETGQTSPMSDLYSLGVVSYEMLTRRRPFSGTSPMEIRQAVLHAIPPPLTELNPAIPPAVAQVIHKALAKRREHRFPSVQRFVECLQQAASGQMLQLFDPATILPRLDSARRTFEGGDVELADEMLRHLEAEGYVDQGARHLRQQIDRSRQQSRLEKLLSHARRLCQAGEYPIALQKIHDLLELDPQNLDALALKDEIGRAQIETSVATWLSLARKHLDGCLYPKAREALQEVLKLQPSHREAAQLSQELELREREYARLCEEKNRLYQSAVNAWKSGEVSSALTKLERVVELDRRAPDAQSTAFQGFYNEVRTEHLSIQSDSGEVRRLINEHQYREALELCGRLLQRYPNNALLQVLKLQAEEKQRQYLSEQMAEASRRLESEVDLDRRVEILSEVLQRFPNERYFQTAHASECEKRDLVKRVAARAQQLDKQGLCAEALNHWEIMRTIYPAYPGLEFEVEIVRFRLEQMQRAQGRERWIQQIEEHRSVGDLGRARDVIRTARVEYPNDAELVRLEEEVQRQLTQAVQAQRLLESGQALLARGEREAGLHTLREAQALDRRNAAVQSALIDALLRQAQLLLETDLAGADVLVAEALAVDPAHSAARSLQALIADCRRPPVMPARAAAQAQGGAMQPMLDARPSLSIDALTVSPDHRPDLMEEFRALDALSESVGDLPSARTTLERAEHLREQCAGDEDLRSAAVRLEQRLRTIIQRLETAPAAETQPPPARWSGMRDLRVLLALGTVLLLFGAALLDRVLRGGAKGQPSQQPAAADRSLASPRPSPLPPAGAPSLPRLQLAWDLDYGTVLIDGSAVGQLEHRHDFTLDAVPAGRHTVEIQTGGRIKAAFPYEAAPGEFPRSVGPLTATNLRAVLLTQAGSRAQWLATTPDMAIRINDGPTIAIPVSGAEQPVLAPGTYRVALISGGVSATRELTVGDGPALHLLLDVQGDSGTLQVELNVSDAQLLVNGKPYPGSRSGGRIAIPYLKSGEYRLSAAKEGYRDVPEQVVRVERGKTASVRFELEPKPVFGALSLTGMPTDAQVLLDGRPLGAVRADGTLQLGQIPPGEHRIELHKPKFRPLVLTRRFVAGETQHLGGGEVALVRLPGRLQVQASVSGAEIVARRISDNRVHPVTPGQPVELEEGSYTVTAKAPRHQPATQTVTISADETASLRFDLAAIPDPKPVVTGMDGWNKPKDWQPERGMLVNRQQGLAVYHLPTENGEISFQLETDGRRRTTWFLHLTEGRSMLLFGLDRKHFYQTVQDGDRRLKEAKVEHRSALTGLVRVTIRVRDGAITHQIAGGPPIPLNPAVAETAKFLKRGSFGFLIREKDWVSIAEFQFAAR